MNGGSEILNTGRDSRHREKRVMSSVWIMLDIQMTLSRVIGSTGLELRGEACARDLNPPSISVFIKARGVMRPPVSSIWCGNRA